MISLEGVMEGCDMGGRKGVLMSGSMGCDYNWERLAERTITERTGGG